MAQRGGGEAPTLLFVGGERKQVGKSTACLSILANLLADGYGARHLAYIKPATQCTKSQLVARFCAAAGIDAVPIGPVVFRSGFTREFLQGDGPSSEEMLEAVDRAVRALAAGKRVVLVDGVGYPAVGSICGVSNAAIAARLGAPALLIGKRGVGDAVDSYNLNATFFEARGVRVLGGVFNRIEDEGYYSVDKCREFVGLYMSRFRPGHTAYGFVPESPGMAEAEEASADAGTRTAEAPSSPEEWRAVLPSESALQALGLSPRDATRIAAAYCAFRDHVDVQSIVRDAATRGRPAAAASAPPPPSSPSATANAAARVSWRERVDETDKCGTGGY